MPKSSGNLAGAIILFLVAGSSIWNVALAKTELTIKSNSQPAVSICAGTNSAIIHSFSLKGSGSGGKVTAISFSNSGLYVSGDISNFKLYYTTTGNFASTNFLGVINIPSNAPIQNFGAFNGITIGNKQELFFWITMDVSTNAVDNHTLTVSKTLPVNVTANINVVEGSPNNASGQQTILRSTGGTANATSSSVCSGNSTTINLSGYAGCVQWQQSPNGSTGWANVTGGSGGTTATYSTPALTSVTYYRAVVTSGSCTSEYSTTTSVAINASGIWLGISNDWNNASNWCGGVPTATTNVTLLSGGIQPVINASSVCHNITISNGASLTISGNNNLTVSGDWTNNGGTFTPGQSTVVFNGTDQSIGGSSATTFFNLTIDGTNVSLTTTNSPGITGVSNSLVINSNKKLTINSGKALTVSGMFTNNSITGLIIKSDAVGTGSFIDSGQTAGSGTARIERYLTPYSSQSPTDYRFHFLSSPVGSDQAIMPEFQTMSNTSDDFYMWNEPTGLWINTKLGSGLPYTWNSAFGAGNGAFITGKAYLVAYPSPAVTKKFIGKPFTGSITTDCTSAGGGWNLIGNPFPSALDWDQVSKGNGIDNALYYYDNEQARYRYYIPLTGGIGTATNGASRYIPAMQGFMVHAKSTGTKTITMDNGDRVHQSQNLYYKSSVLTSNVLNVSVEGNDLRDEARICFFDMATSDFDGEYDAYKLFSYNPGTPELYSLTGDSTQLAINTLPLSKKYVTVPLGFKPGSAGTFTFSASGVGSFPASTNLYLEDLVTGTTQKLNDNPDYSFSSNPGDAPCRFRIRFQESTSFPDPTLMETLNIRFTDGNINIITPETINADIIITNMLGQVVLRGETNGNTLTTLNANTLPNGIYIASLAGNNKAAGGKFIISR